MKKVTARIKAAFEAGESLTVGNTRTDGKSVFLHGNEIIRRYPSGLAFWTLAGWPTVTTRERINGILGVGVYQERGVQKVNGVEIDIEDWQHI